MPERTLESLGLTRLSHEGPAPVARTPVAGMYLCGSGAHPGGGVMGVPGHNAARTVAADLAGRGEGAAPSPVDAPIPSVSLVDNLLSRPRSRRALVACARHPALGPLVDRLSRRD